MSTELRPTGAQPTDADIWMLDPEHLDETRAALATIEDKSNPGIRPLLRLVCDTLEGELHFEVLKTVGAPARKAYGDLRQLVVRTVPFTVSARFNLGRPGKIRAVLDRDADGVAIYAREIPAVVIAGKKAKRLPAKTLHTEVSRVPVAGLADVLGSASASLIGLDIGASKPLARRPDVDFLRAVPNLTWLDLRDNKKVLDLAPVAACTKLEVLTLSGCTAVADLAPLRGLARVRELDLDGCTGLHNLAPLAGLDALEVVELRRCRALGTVAPLANLPTLRRVALNDAGVAEGLDQLRGKAGLEVLT